MVCGHILSDTQHTSWTRAVANLNPESQRVVFEASWMANKHGGVIAIDDVRWEGDTICKGINSSQYTCMT